MLRDSKCKPYLDKLSKKDKTWLEKEGFCFNSNLAWVRQAVKNLKKLMRKD